VGSTEDSVIGRIAYTCPYQNVGSTEDSVTEECAYTCPYQNAGSTEDNVIGRMCLYMSLPECGKY
jgi:hypothetical protein